MMKKLMITAGALAVAATMATAPANAGGYGYGHIYLGKKVHVTFYGGDYCYKYKKKAKRAERHYNWELAEYWWSRYWDCKNGY